MISKRNSRVLSSLVSAAIFAAGVFATGPVNRVMASAPSLTVATPAGVMYDRVLIKYTVQNSPAASFNLKVEYSTNGPAGPYATATEAPGSPSEGTSALAASEAGSPHVFVWNPFYDLNNVELYNANAIVRVTTIDRMSGAVVGSAQTAAFKVDNRVVAVALGQSGVAIPSVGDGGPATSARIFLPAGLSLARDGSILLAEVNGARVRQFTVGGKIATIVGNGIAATESPTTTPVPANSSVTRNSRGVCMDSNGVVLVTYQVSGTSSLLLATNPVTGSIVRVAGGGMGPAADGPALTATFTLVRGCIALPPVPGTRQVVLLTDDNRIRRFQYVYNATTGNIDPASATIDTICGSATAGSSPDGTLAKSAQLSMPFGMFYDPASKKLFVADQNNNLIRAIGLPDPNGAPGTINTVAGNGTSGFSGDGGPATAAQLARPSNVALNPATGMMYILDNNNNRIRQFTIGGVINTVAGNGRVGVAGIGGPALQANVSSPNGGLLVARDGSVLISAQGTNQVLALTPDGNLTAVAGAPPSSVQGEGGQANQAPISTPGQCAVSGNSLYVSDLGSRFIRKVDLSTGIVTRFAGNGVGGGDFLEGMPALDASINPNLLTADTAGNVYYSSGFQIYKVDTQGKITLFAGTGVSGTTGDNGPAREATLTAVNTLAFSNVSGSLYVAAGGRIRRVDRNGIITTVGGGGTLMDEGVPATQANFGVNGMAIDPSTETIYVVDGTRHLAFKFVGGGNVTFLAGVLNTPGFTPDGAVARGARIRQPSGIGVDAQGNVFFGEIGSLLVRWIDTNGILRTVAGTGRAGPISEGSVPTQCSFTDIRSIFVESQGNIYFSPDPFNIVRFRPF